MAPLRKAAKISWISEDTIKVENDIYNFKSVLYKAVKGLTYRENMVNAVEKFMNDNDNYWKSGSWYFEDDDILRLTASEFAVIFSLT